MLSQKNVMGMNAGSSISESRNALKGDNMSIKNVYAQIVSFDNLLQAEKDARAGKRYENEQIAFWGNLEDNIHSISEKLKCHNYPPDIYHHFYVYEPKLRKVIFSDYTTKVIQRAAYNVLNPIVCKGMISDTYSCIEDRGQLKSMQRLAGWVDFVEKSGERWYYLKMDVEKFFYRMDHEVLMSIIRKKIGDKEAVRFLEHYVCHASRAFGLPLGVKSPLEISDKEMLWDVGIAIGGGLSHMYGNMYLNPMDQMAKRKEGIQYYIWCNSVYNRFGITCSYNLQSFPISSRSLLFCSSWVPVGNSCTDNSKSVEILIRFITYLLLSDTSCTAVFQIY